MLKCPDCGDEYPATGMVTMCPKCLKTLEEQAEPAEAPRETADQRAPPEPTTVPSPPGAPAKALWEREDESPPPKPTTLPSSADAPAQLQPHRGAVVLVLGLAGIVMTGFLLCTGPVCGVIAWVVANRDLAQIRAGRMDPRGEGLILVGKLLGIVSLVLGILVFVLFVGRALGQGMVR